MPPNSKLPPAPPRMTWAKASPVLIVTGIFWVLRLFALGLVFFGPALATILCATKLSTYVGTSIGTKVCVIGGASLGVAGADVMIPMGATLAIVVGFWGAIVIVSLIYFTGNSRLFKEGGLLGLGAGFLVSVVPFLDGFPSVFAVVVRAYSKQIKRDAEKYTKWQKQVAELQKNQQTQRAQAAQEAANDAIYAQEAARRAA